MASTYVNDLRLNEMATGDESGTWGTSTNTNLELIAEAFSYGTEAITTNADTHTTTIADGATDPGRALYLKYTGTLDSACTITIGPNTVSKVWIVENGTSGSQDIILSQGSGANITIPAGDTKVVYSDGAGAGAAFFDAFASLSVVDLKGQDDLDISGDIDVDGTTNLDVVDIDGAVDMASTALVTGVLTANGGAVFNEAGADVDFRVESDTVDHALFVQGSDGSVGIGASSPNTKLEVTGDISGTWTPEATRFVGSQYLTGSDYQLGMKTTMDTRETQIFAKAADTGGYVTIATGTTPSERLRVDGSGNVGIGISVPTAQLHLSKAGGTLIKLGTSQNTSEIEAREVDSGNSLVFSSNNSTDHLVIDGSGKLLVGSTANLGTALLNVAGGIDVADSDYPYLKLKLASNESIVEAAGQYQNMTVGGTGANAYLRFKTADTERMRIDVSGNVLVGTTAVNATSAKLTVVAGGNGISLSVGNGNVGAYMTNTSGTTAWTPFSFNNNGTTFSQIGSISCTPTATAYNISSDYRLKENVVTDWDATTRLKQLKPSRFNFIADADKTVDGFLAHEVQDVVPEAITGAKDAMRDEEYEVTPAVLDDDGNVVTEAVMGTRSVPDYQGIDQSKLVPLLVKTIQELEARITALES
jgi:hypothetical protein